MQYAREQAAREQRMKEEKQAQDIAESKSRQAGIQSESDRRKAQTEGEAAKRKAEAQQANVDEMFKTAEANRKREETGIEQQRADALKVTTRGRLNMPTRPKPPLGRTLSLAGKSMRNPSVVTNLKQRSMRGRLPSTKPS